MNTKIAIIGGGSWGTALAQTLGKNGHKVALWDIDTNLVKNMKKDRENKKYLPNIILNDNVELVSDVSVGIKDANIVLFAAPAQRFRSALENALEYLTEDMIVVNVAKGIEIGTHKRMSEIAEEIIPNMSYVVLSGPSHAEEVGQGLPTTVSAASKDNDAAVLIQHIFSNETFRVYTNEDIIGVELGGSLKNIIALGAGISDGLKYGDNAKAALMTRGIAEMKRLGVKLGANPETFSGLSGVGDLIVTCTSMHSRNRRCGIMIGEGMNPEEAVEKVGMVVEGMYTAEAAYELAKITGVELPISEGIYKIVHGDIEAKEVAKLLMIRDKKDEMLIY
ncbi:MAG: NAD(P)H-dependent glycerol-3-phosphate dehydrogenase [Peptostreptococcaceae bacterium]|nr:NAD(P)H-dependent glycerol-3-phosphate dehydrogenase [Peptostreptococcaceae bacterium]